MIPKKNKPTPSEFRPIALTNNSYKICMGIIKDKIENHLQMNSSMEEQQFGFTKGRRTTDSIYSLNFAIEYSNKKKIPLILTFIDYKKAFDSVNRNKLLDMLIKYKIHPSIIDIIINIYNGDKTNLKKGERETNEIEITSGIKQGCTGSTILFLMVTYLIIETINSEYTGLKIGDFKISSLFFADDGVILSTNRNEAENIINKLEEISEICGLKLNKEKSCNIIMKNKEQIAQIANIKVINSTKYLGVEISTRRDIYKSHKKDKIQKAKSLSNMIYGIISRSSNKMLIGKTYWKNVVVPDILYAGEVITYNKEEIKALQTAENQAYRQILGAPKYTPACVLRAEIGSSSMQSRDIKNKLLFYKHLMESENELIRKIIEVDEANEITKFMKTTKEYLRDLHINKEFLRNNKAEGIKRKINEKDTMIWKEEINEKSSLRIYKELKNEIKEEKFYDNSEKSHLLFKGRSNTLKLNWRQRFLNPQEDPEETTKCPMCKLETEDDIHFLVKCQDLQNIRRNSSIWHQGIEDMEFIRRVLCFDGKEDGKETLAKMWKERQKKLD